MKKSLIPLILALSLGLTCAGAGAEPAPDGLAIRMTVDDTPIYIQLEDNSASRALLGQLPLTLTFEDYNGTEKIAYPPETLDTSGAPTSCDPEEGTLAYYAPWGNVCIFYRDFRFSEGLTPLGYIEDNLALLSNQQGGFEALLEDAAQPPQQ